MASRQYPLTINEISFLIVCIRRSVPKTSQVPDIECYLKLVEREIENYYDSHLDDVSKTIYLYANVYAVINWIFRLTKCSADTNINAHTSQVIRLMTYGQYIDHINTSILAPIFNFPSNGIERCTFSYTVMYNMVLAYQSSITGNNAFYWFTTTPNALHTSENFQNFRKIVEEFMTMDDVADSYKAMILNSNYDTNPSTMISQLFAYITHYDKIYPNSVPTHVC
jgi:hypothetical protein